MKKQYEEMKELLEEQMKKILKKGDISPQELESLYKASSVVLDFETREAMKKAEEEKKEMEKGQSMRGGYSQHYPPMYWQSMGNSGNSYDGSYRQGQMSREGQSMGGGSMAGGSMAGGQSNEQWGNSREGSSNRSYGYSGEGSSNRSYDSSREGSYERGRSRDGYSEDGYSGEGSYRRGRNERTGRYTSREGSYDGSYEGSYDRYSRAEEKEHMLRRLKEMLDDATSEKQIKAIEQCIERISR